MARDLIHEIVKEALIKDGWTITHDPYRMEQYDPAWEIDFGAEKLIAAERGMDKIAVEAKSFLELSFGNEFHKILGQYLNYLSALKRLEPNRILYVAVPTDVYAKDFQRQGIINSVNDYNVKIFIFDKIEKEVVSWLV
jgi:XisH protein